MHRRTLSLLLSVVIVASCKKAQDSEHKPSHSEAKANAASAESPGVRPVGEQVKPPFDLKTPPADAVKTPSGLIYKKLTAHDDGQVPKRNDTVMVNYTGWRQATGETFFSNRTRGQPMPLNLANTAAGFVEAMQLLKKGEKAMLWVPPAIGYKGQPEGTPETLVYEVEVVDIAPAPAIPHDVAAAPQGAQVTKGGVAYSVVRPGTGAAKARSFDTVTYHLTTWEPGGRMIETTEMKNRPTTIAPYRQSSVLEQVLTTMTTGQRVRFWTTGEKLAQGSTPNAAMPKGPVCGEVALVAIEKGGEPPATPADVGSPPASAKKSAKGVSYKVLQAGKGGAKPKPTDTVKVNYTGWTTDGRMFDSSTIRNQPAEFSLQGVIAGWTDGIPLMSVGDKYRFWVPEELAYKGQPGRPSGMLVFDVELLEIKAAPPPHGGGMPHDHP